LGILKEAMVDMLTALRGIGMVDCKQRLRSGRLLRLLAVIEERNAKLDARNGQRQVDESVPRMLLLSKGMKKERKEESLLLCMHYLIISFITRCGK
jgi:hypothetical protein